MGATIGVGERRTLPFRSRKLERNSVSIVGSPPAALNAIQCSMNWAQALEEKSCSQVLSRQNFRQHPLWLAV